MEGLSIERVQPDRYEEFVDFIYDSFFTRERLSIGTGLNRKPNFAAKPMFRSWLADGLSLIAVDNATNRIAAIALNFIVLPSFCSPANDSKLGNELRTMFSFLDELDKGYDIFQQFNADRGVELVFLCVHQDYCGRGLAKKLTETTLEIAKEAGFAFVKCNPTAKATTHIFEILGFETINEMKVKDFYINQRPAFPYAAEDDVVRLCVMQM